MSITGFSGLQKCMYVRLIAKLSSTRPDIISGRAKLESINVTYQDGLLHVYVEGFLAKDQVVDKRGVPDVHTRVDLFREYLSKDIGEPVVVEFEAITIDMIHIRSQPPEGSGG